ncbi:MAG: hypothetical protein QOE13_419 [Gaiellaceae bacterium]|jgi:hypothetical protein|nr:hypothetical protein [Gaiellaceae bacterium]
MTLWLKATNRSSGRQARLVEPQRGGRGELVAQSHKEPAS